MKILSFVLGLALLLPTAASAQNVLETPVLNVSADVAATIDTSAEVTTEDDTAPDFGDFITNSAGVYVTTANQVTTDADIDVLGNNLMTGDEKLVAFNASKQTEVTASYKHDGRLFAIFPVSVKSDTKVSVNENGEVVADTVLPWWNFFVVGTGSVAAEVDTALAARADVAAAMQTSAEAVSRAEVLEAIVSAHMAFETTGSVN